MMYGGSPSADGLNTLGYKGDIPDKDKPRDEYRIVVLGGSTVLQGEPPIPDLIEAALKSLEDHRVEVYNFGVVSSVSRMELIRLLLQVVDYDPDLVIFYNGGNDFICPLYWDPRPGYPMNFIVYEHNPLMLDDIRKYKSVPFFLYGSNILRAYIPSYFAKSFIPLNEVKAEVGWMTSDWRERIAQTYVQNIVKAQKIADTYGFDLITVYQPLVFFKDYPDKFEKRILKLSLGEEGKSAALDVRKRILRKMKREEDIQFHDFSDKFDSLTQRVFSDTVHVTQEGRKLIAEEIVKILRMDKTLAH